MVLLPCSSKSRILQLLLMLENFFTVNQKLQGAVGTGHEPVVYLEHMSTDMFGVARSHLGWMNFKDNKVFQDIDENPITFTYVRPLHRVDDLVGFTGPRVIVTSLSSMEMGLVTKLISMDFFKLEDTRNEIIFI